MASGPEASASSRSTTDSKHELPVRREPARTASSPASEPDSVWASDITYIATDEGWLYLAVVIDLFSRQVVGWSMQPHMKRELVIDALQMACFRRYPPKRERCFERFSNLCSGITSGSLQRRGLIKYSRGHIQVLDHTGLQITACECYQVVRDLVDGDHRQKN